MSLIKPALWATVFKTPMPEGMTYWEFATLRDKKWAKESITDSWGMLRLYQGLAEKYPDNREIQRLLHTNIGSEKAIIKHNAGRNYHAKEL